MGEQTKIEWCDSTWNPWYCCREVSAGCENCYARAWARRAGKAWGQPIRAAEKTFHAPQHWAESRKIFVGSLSDFFFDTSYDFHRLQKEATIVMASACWHRYLLLTKRPQNIAPALEKHMIESIWPWRSIWLGVTVENQDAVWRIEELAKVPAAIRWVSFEPLVGPVEVPDHLWDELDWIVIGGESGPKARPMDPDWVEDLMIEADENGKPVFFKQWGEWAPFSGCSVDPFAMNPRSIEGHYCRLYRVGRKNTLNLWDGQALHEYPRQCRVCRCTDRMPCNDPIDGPCHWIAADLCSSCATEAACES